MERKHDHLRSLEIECEKCGGEAKVVNRVYPQAFECVCKDCEHTFIWTSPEEKR